MSDYKEWFIITRDLVTHSRHNTLVEAALAAAEHEALTGDEAQTRKIIHRGLVPEIGHPVSIGWLNACTRHWVLGANSETGEYEAGIPIGWDWFEKETRERETRDLRILLEKYGTPEDKDT